MISGHKVPIVEVRHTFEQITLHKKINFLIIVFLFLFIFSTLFVTIPETDAHSPPLTLETSAFISVSPNPSWLFQTVNITVWLDRAPPNVSDSENCWSPFIVKITKPDGTIETLGPYPSDNSGHATIQYCPTQTGHYTLQFIFPGQTIQKNTSAGSSINCEYENDTFLPSSAFTTLTVQASAPTTMPSATPTPQPTSTLTPKPTSTLPSELITWCEVGVPYLAPDGLTVTVSNIQILEQNGSYKYLINYTLQNESWDLVSTEGTFLIRTLNGTIHEHQRGMFISMYPGNVFVKNYQFIVGSNNIYKVLEYRPSNYYSSNYLCWKIQNASDQPSNTTFTANLNLSCRSIPSYSNFRVEITGSLTDNDAVLANIPIQLLYSVNGGTSWIDLTQVTTNNKGCFSAVWLPSVTGNNLIKATWTGNSTYATTTTIVNFAITTFQEQNVFSVTSNSTLSELTFNSSNRTLIFSVSGQSGTKGYIEVTIPKSIINDTSGVTIYLDNTPIPYSIKNQAESSIITFQYKHSSHQIQVELGNNSTSFKNEPLPIIISAIIVIASAIIITITVIVKLKMATH